MSQASLLKIICSFLLCFELCWAFSNVITIWEGTLDVGWADDVLVPIEWTPPTWYFPSGATMTETAPEEGEYGVIQRTIYESCQRSLAFNLGSWHLVFVGIGSVPVLLVSCVLAWLFIPDVYRGGRVRETFLRILRGIWMLVAISGAWPLFLKGVRVAFQHAHLSRFIRGELGPGAPTHFDSPLFNGGGNLEVITSVLGAGVLVLGWMVGMRISRGASPVAPRIENAPRCRSCGYSLAHVPASGRCPECGQDVRESVSPNPAPRLAWQRSDMNRLTALTSTTQNLLLHPSIAYRWIRFGEYETRNRSFTRAHWGLLCTLALLVIICDTAGNPDWIGYSLRLGLFHDIVVRWFIVCIAGWVLYRSVAVVAICLCALHGNPQGTRAMCTVVHYEVVALWMFLFANGALLLFDSLVQVLWIALGEFFGFSRTQMPTGSLWFVGLCNGALIVAWAWRYRSAWRAVRYANL